jgi:hypothetical protein
VETRPYFLFGDMLSTALIGTLAGCASVCVVRLGWNGILAMACGTVPGMAIALLLGAGVFFPLFGSLEVMLPGMMAGMGSGMVAGMLRAMGVVGYGSAPVIGAVVGLAALGATYAVNAQVRGETGPWTS